MSDTSSPLILLVVIALGLGIRLIAGRLDRDRIREYIKNGGGQVLHIVWNPFGPGWWGSRERIYDVTYKTHNGEVREATCKTTMFSGVYWTGDAALSGLVERHGISPRTGEAIDCLKCGSKIPPQQSHCHNCGWSYVGK